MKWFSLAWMAWPYHPIGREVDEMIPDAPCSVTTEPRKTQHERRFLHSVSGPTDHEKSPWQLVSKGRLMKEPEVGGPCGSSQRLKEVTGF